MVLLSARSLNQFRLEKYVITPLPKNIINNGSIENHDDFVVQMQQIWKKFRPNCKNISVAMPPNSTTLQFLTLDHESENTLDERIILELNQSDANENNLSYDYQVLNETKQGTEFLLVSSKREDVDRTMDAFTDAGITPTQMDVDLLAVINSYIVWLNETQTDISNQTTAIFDIGVYETRAIFMRDNHLVYKQEINIGYEQMVQIIRRDYQLTEEEAWDMFYNANKPSDYTATVAQPFQQQFIQEIQRTLQFYYTTSIMEIDSNIDQILIFGYASNDAKGFDKKIQEQTKIVTQQLNPVLMAESNSKIDQMQLMQDSNLLTVAFGLAVRGL